MPGPATQAGPGGALNTGSLLQNRRYLTIRLLGRGGMGAVYLARDMRLSRLCVVKELIITSIDPAERSMAEAAFQREALLLARLSEEHFDIPQTYDYFIEGQSHYLVMQYIEGENLEQRLQRSGKPLPDGEVVAYALAVSDILCFLHGQQPEPVIHRDIKPANIIVDKHGRVKLVDFGLAKSLVPLPAASARKGTQSLGTPGYTAIEQWLRQAEPRSDVRALGATMHHLLTGRDPQAPFAQHPDLNMNLLRQYDRLPSFNSLGVKVAPSLEKLMNRMLAEDVRSRPHANEIRNELERLANQKQKHKQGAALTKVLPPPPTLQTPAPLAPVIPPGSAIDVQNKIRAYLQNTIKFLPAGEPRVLTVGSPELIPVGTLNFGVNTRFVTSAGQMIHQINERGILAMRGDTGAGLPLDASIFVAAQAANAKDLSILSPALTANPPDFLLSDRDVNEKAIEQLVARFSCRISYLAGNGRQYTRDCAPRKKDINLRPGKRVYAVAWPVTVTIGASTYHLSVSDARGSMNLGVLASNLAGDAYCPVCTTPVPSAGGSFCMICRHWQCQHHMIRCSVCSDLACQNCRSNCAQCAQPVCAQHRRICTNCRRPFCANCIHSCETCNAPVCGGCAQARRGVLSKKLRYFCKQACLDSYQRRSLLGRI